MKAWGVHVGVAVLSFGAGALAWNMWDRPKAQSVWHCPALLGEGLHAGFWFYRDQNALQTRIDGYFANTYAYAGGGAYVAALKDGEIARGGYFWDEGRDGAFYEHVDYTIREGEQPDLAEMTTHYWIEIADMAAAVAHFGQDQLEQIAQSKEDAVARVRPCQLSQKSVARRAAAGGVH